MNLTNKLRQFLPQQNRATPSPNPPVDLDLFLQGQEVFTPFGACYVVQKNLPLQKKHGFWRIGNGLEVESHNLKVLGQEPPEDFKVEDALFLDTETTGLSGGTGTYAFLIGTGRFISTHFVVKQFLMRDYNEELAVLYLVDQELQKTDTVISFNGKTFDLPLLHTRFTISRLGFQGAQNHHHLDLLHMARKLWRKKLESCSLNSLEANILGINRTNDIPGFEIPGRYFQFLQTRQGELLQDILQHNVIDIVSMAILLYRLTLTTELSPEECDCPWEAEALAQIALSRGDHQQAISYLEAARQLCTETEQEISILHQNALIHKRQAQYDQASALWRRILMLNEDDLVAYEELAKFYEHKAKDLGAADQLTRRALAVAWQAKSAKIPALEHRLSRIERKLG